jgi:hypothetical protein
MAALNQIPTGTEISIGLWSNMLTGLGTVQAGIPMETFLAVNSDYDNFYGLLHDKKMLLGWIPNRAVDPAYSKTYSTVLFGIRKDDIFQIQGVFVSSVEKNNGVFIIKYDPSIPDHTCICMLTANGDYK